MRYRAYLSGLDMLIAIALMLPSISLFAYSVHSSNGNLHAYTEGVIGGVLSNAKLQELISSDWTNATAFSSMLNKTVGQGYGIEKAPAYPSGNIPVDASRLAVIGGDVYYVESGGNESANIG